MPKCLCLIDKELEGIFVTGSALWLRSVRPYNKSWGFEAHSTHEKQGGR